MLARGEPLRCLACGSVLAEDVSIEKYFRRSPLLCRLFNALVEHPYGLTKSELLFAVYNGIKEPDWDPIGVRVCAFNKKCKVLGLGVRIRCVCESGRRFRIFVVR